MKKIKIIAILLAVISVFFTACREPQEFEKAPIITTTRAEKTTGLIVYSDLTVFKTKMGMSIEETQKAVGTTINLYMSEKGQYYFIINKKNLDFVTKDKEVPVYFIFDGNNRLCEIQYETGKDTGFELNAAIKQFDKLYGKHIESKKTDKVNYVWYSKGDYILITITSTGRNAITYVGEKFFEKNNPEEFKLYNGQNKKTP